MTASIKQAAAGSSSPPRGEAAALALAQRTKGEGAVLGTLVVADYAPPPKQDRSE